MIHLQSRYVVQNKVHSHFDLVSWLLGLEATEPVPEPVTQMAVEFISFSTANEMSLKATFFFM